MGIYTTCSTYQIPGSHASHSPPIIDSTPSPGNHRNGTNGSQYLHKRFSLLFSESAASARRGCGGRRARGVVVRRAVLGIEVTMHGDG